MFYNEQTGLENSDSEMNESYIDSRNWKLEIPHVLTSWFTFCKILLNYKKFSGCESTYLK